MSLNLHAIVRSAITAVNPDNHFLLIQSVGEENRKGVITALYADAVKVTAQMQSLNGDDLQQFENTLRTEINRKFYLNVSKLKPTGQIRVKGRTGDFLHCLKDDTYWRIFSVSEDFSNSGWVLVFASLQVTAPKSVTDKVQTWRRRQIC